MFNINLPLEYSYISNTYVNDNKKLNVCSTNIETQHIFMTNKKRMNKNV